ncbi:hypothetical protein [Thermogutta sp.]|uniref:hypothetical protein n=1 Tax=Thermogutta sp. TaxID=1962930 RepID=UPI00321FED14
MSERPQIFSILNAMAKSLGSGNAALLQAACREANATELYPLVSIVAQYPAVSITLSGDLHTALRCVVIDPQMYVVAYHRVDPGIAKKIISLVASAGANPSDNTVRLTSTEGGSSIVRLTVALDANNVSIFFRCFSITLFPLSNLIGTTIPQRLADFVIRAYRYVPGCVLIVCGPAASGKSTLMNALLQYAWTQESHTAKIPSGGVAMGDAVDVVVPDHMVVIAQPSGYDAAVSAVRSANTNDIVFGELASESTLLRFLDAIRAATRTATTTHGHIPQVYQWLRQHGTVFLEMAVVGSRRIVIAAAVNLADITLGQEQGLMWIARFNPVSGEWVYAEQMKRAEQIVAAWEERRQAWSEAR